MGSYVPAATLEKFSVNGPHSVTYVVTASHTASLPHTVILDRQLPAMDAKSGNETYARMRIRNIRACADENGLPNGKASVVETSIRYPASAVQANVEADLALNAAIMADVGYVEDVISLALPV